MAVGQLLHVDAAWLWPRMTSKLTTPDLIHVYNWIGDVPAPLWLSVVRSAHEVVQIATDAALLLQISDFAEASQVQAAQGVKVRLCVGCGHPNHMITMAANLRLS